MTILGVFSSLNTTFMVWYSFDKVWEKKLFKSIQICVVNWIMTMFCKMIINAQIYVFILIIVVCAIGLSAKSSPN
jgi:hypothetical protein